MKIIITGALGHIGSYLIRRLPDFFDMPEIVMIDDLSTQRYAALFNLPSNAKYEFIEADVTKDNEKLVHLFHGADVVIHLAAITNAAASFDNADEVERVNLNATKNVATACVKAKVRMIMASSTSVYGTQEKTVDENCTADELKPQSPYATTKLAEEAFVQEKCANENLAAVIFRFGTIFGISPGMRFHTAVNKFCWQAVMGSPLTVWKTAYHQKRPYLALDDAAGAIIFMIGKNIFNGQVHNIVSVNATVADVVESIKIHRPNLKINFVDNQIMNQLSYEVLNTRMNALGFKPTGDLQKSVAETLALFKNISYSR
ncbi:MAG: nucleoside-diphosphate sugar epimerase [Gammaproteobacteria bacterium RIFCSPHIGHO2_12_FULL_38_11]|nr:MAG: nucleoside-diphosphate sugar epimerase [Gammaproteobacteria bacterium RIFCSPHIGHO2_12_FULL_38_11]